MRIGARHLLLRLLPLQLATRAERRLLRVGLVGFVVKAAALMVLSFSLVPHPVVPPGVVFGLVIGAALVNAAGALMIGVSMSGGLFLEPRARRALEAAACRLCPRCLYPFGPQPGNVTCAECGRVFVGDEVRRDWAWSYAMNDRAVLHLRGLRG